MQNTEAMEILIKAGAVYNIALIVFHLFFRRIFHWDDDLRSLSFLNKAIMPVLNNSLIVVFALFAYVSLFHYHELLSTPLGNAMLAFMALFFFARSAMQVIYCKLRHWASYAFLLFFFSCGLVYALAFLSVM
jgi:uncharacterized paraquat-inducible protein A